jgi:hypothetical protein
VVAAGAVGSSSGSGISLAAWQRRGRRAAHRQRDCGEHGRGSRRYRRAATGRCHGGNEDTGGDSDVKGADKNQQSTKSSGVNGDGNGNDDSDDDDDGSKGDSSGGGGGSAAAARGRWSAWQRRRKRGGSAGAMVSLAAAAAAW